MVELIPEHDDIVHTSFDDEKLFVPYVPVSPDDDQNEQLPDIKSLYNFDPSKPIESLDDLKALFDCCILGTYDKKEKLELLQGALKVYPMIEKRAAAENGKSEHSRRGAIVDMIYQIQHDKSPLVIFDENELKRRKELIEGADGLINQTKSFVEENLTIDYMKSMFGENVSQEDFEQMKLHILNILTEKKFRIDYFSLGLEYPSISGFHSTDTGLIINIGTMNNYIWEMFVPSFMEVLLHEVTHTLQTPTKSGVRDVFLTPYDGSASNFLGGIFSEGGTIAFASSFVAKHDIEGLYVTGNYHFESVIGLYYLFYAPGKERYAKIFNDIQFFGRYPEGDEFEEFSAYIQQELEKDPLKTYLELKTQHSDIMKSAKTYTSELSSINQKIFDQLQLMVGDGLANNVFLSAIYPEWDGGEILVDFKQKSDDFHSRNIQNKQSGGLSSFDTDEEPPMQMNNMSNKDV